MASNTRVLLPQTTIAGAVTAAVGEVVMLPQMPIASLLAVQAAFLYGSGGTTAKAWVQTSLDDGASWFDIMNFAFTTAALTKVSAVNLAIALAAGVTPSDATLADNTILNGVFGDRLRVKWTTTGTYAGASSLRINAVVR